MDIKKIKIVRNKLDKLDHKLLNLIKKRTILVNQVIKIKKYKKQIVDKVRIKKVLNNVKKYSLRRKIDTKITHAIWKTMIRSYINYEKKNFKNK